MYILVFLFFPQPLLISTHPKTLRVAASDTCGQKVTQRLIIVIIIHEPCTLRRVTNSLRALAPATSPATMT